MRRRNTILVAVLLVCFASVVVPVTPSIGLGPAAADDHTQHPFIQSCATEPPDDYDDPDGGNDVIGWVDGYWYNEPLAIDTADGLNRTELEMLSGRTAARYEAMRCWTASDGLPPISIQTREQYQRNNSDLFANVTTKDRLYGNAQYETTMMIGSETDYWQLREENRGSTVQGFYNFQEDRIVIVSDSPDSLLIDEQTLAQELGHAIQDQQFNLSRYDPETTDADLGQQAVIEGDANLIDYRYQQACEDGLWDQPCVTESSQDGDGGGGELASWGLYLTNFQPYSDGQSFIEYLHEERYDGNWSAIDALYANDRIPETAYPSVYPDQFGAIDYADVEVEDWSDDNWERLTFDESADYDTFGVAGISAMFMRPAYEEQTAVWDPRQFLNPNSEGGVDAFDPIDYAQPATEGWRDDKMFVYTNQQNQTGTVWKLAWASEDSRDRFLDSHETLVTDVSGGERVDGYERTYTFGEDSKFDMALTVVPDGDRVTIVKAPTVDDLTAVHQNIELLEATDRTGDDNDDGDGPGDESSDDGSDDTVDDDSDDDGTTSDSAGDDSTHSDDNAGDDDTDGADTEQTGSGADDADGPGFSAGLAVVALLASGLLVRLRVIDRP